MGLDRKKRSGRKNCGGRLIKTFVPIRDARPAIRRSGHQTHADQSHGVAELWAKEVLRGVKIKVEHRLFAQITRNWRGRPPGSLEVIISLIASTTSRAPRVMCEADPCSYEAGTRVSDEETGALDISREDFHGEWNHVIRPRDTGW